MATQAQDELFIAGDIITIAGVYADGTREASETSKESYRNASPQYFRVAEVLVFDGVRRVRLIPVNEDGSEQAFRAATTDIWITGPA